MKKKYLIFAGLIIVVGCAVVYRMMNRPPSAALSPDDENMTITLSYPDYGEVGKEKPSLRKLSTILKWSGLSFK